MGQTGLDYIVRDTKYDDVCMKNNVIEITISEQAIKYLLATNREETNISCKDISLINNLRIQTKQQ